ncbi:MULTISPECIES: mitochondrial fission ELM1 family protein [unclassified Brevundimonas]|uniref:mitochondrial fission ELM1 family protein n=1 Tax=unclassified Brevundimonas TaxID=2622653 RepID=UPI0025C3402A|nr:MULTISPECIES: mitochondrial fission ELM1 family protein [unclassified Brevundimonas]
MEVNATSLPDSGARSSAARPLSIWVVSDGRTGIENQSLGLAEAIAAQTPAAISRHIVRWKPAFDRWPSGLKQPWMLDQGRELLGGPDFPDIWIATGRATLPLSVRIKTASKGRTFVVQTQDPRWKNSAYDLIVAPEHDGVSGPNVLSILGSPHRITPQKLADAAPAFAKQIEALPHPRVAVMIGGTSKAFDLTLDHAAILADLIAETVEEQGGSVLVTFSRRTPLLPQTVMTQRLKALPGMIWDGTGENPLFAMLHYADHILVTEDSANMATEAASTGKPVHILPMVPLRPQTKFRRLHAALEKYGATRPFDGTLPRWTYEPLSETRRAARAILGALPRGL